MSQPAATISPDKKLHYAGIYLLKKLDLEVDDGGMALELLLPPEFAPLEDVVDYLVASEYIDVDPKRPVYELTKQGITYVGQLIDEVEAYIDEFDDMELPDVLSVLRQRNLDLFRVRFLWGWYEGEFDDLVLFQQRRGIEPVEDLWAYFLVSDEFFNNLALDLAG